MQPPHLQNPTSTFLFPFPDELESPLTQIFSQTLTPNMTQDKQQLLTSRAAERRKLGVVPRRRTGKKDRHSKICTAQGVRDRRMRLSLQVARKFFDLQDMLGFDKASKTIEWLFSKSKKAINELTNHHNSNSANEVKSESLLSECEVVSGSMVPRATRESREKARARARTRTREKMMDKCLNPNYDEKLGFSPFEVCDPYHDVGTIEKLLGHSAADFMGFFGNWDLLNNERSSSSFTNHVSLAGNPNDEFP